MTLNSSPYILSFPGWESPAGSDGFEIMFDILGIIQQDGWGRGREKYFPF